MQEQSIFTRIINGEIPCHKVYEDEQVIAILTNHPVIDGHTLVIPKKQVAQIWDLELQDYNYLWDVVSKIAKHLRSVLKVERVGVVIKGIEVPHAHIHLIPMPHDTYVNFDPIPPPSTTDDDILEAVANRLRL